MKYRYSFETAQDLIDLLLRANYVLVNSNEHLKSLHNRLSDTFHDQGFDEFDFALGHAYSNCADINQNLRDTITYLAKYKEEMHRLYTSDLINQIAFPKISYEPDVRFGTAGEILEQKNLLLAFQNEIKMKFNNVGITDSVKEVYAAIGSKCVIKSDTFMGTPFFNSLEGFIKFNREFDLHNPCGPLSTYFHEVGHMIDFTVRPGKALSNDIVYQEALRLDFDNLVNYTKKRFGCSKEDAYYHISQELMTNNDLFADVSDILGGMTNCMCQNLWGHDRAYWNEDPDRVQQEAFANMYSTSIGDSMRIEAMMKYFPTAYSRFEKIMEEII